MVLTHSDPQNGLIHLDGLLQNGVLTVYLGNHLLLLRIASNELDILQDHTHKDCENSFGMLLIQAILLQCLRSTIAMISYKFIGLNFIFAIYILL